MEILVVGDSLPFGRPSHGICRDKTWPYLLQSELMASLCMRAHSGSTSLDVLSEVANLADYWFGPLQARRFDAAFVQVGIVDSTPRLVPKRLYPCARKIPGFSCCQRSKRLHKVFGRPWVSSKQFVSSVASLDNLLRQLADRVFFVEIAMPDHYLKQNVGDFSALVSHRNRLIAGCIGERSFVPCWRGVAVPQYLLPDGHHLNEEGHQVVAKQCLGKIL